MTPEPLLVPDYLVHILQAIERIRKYISGISEEDFYSDQLIQDAVIRNIEVIGEAARNAQLCGKDIAEVQNSTQWAGGIACEIKSRMDIFQLTPQSSGTV